MFHQYSKDRSCECSESQTHEEMSDSHSKEESVVRIRFKDEQDSYQKDVTEIVPQPKKAHDTEMKDLVNCTQKSTSAGHINEDFRVGKPISIIGLSPQCTVTRVNDTLGTSKPKGDNCIINQTQTPNICDSLLVSDDEATNGAETNQVKGDELVQEKLPLAICEEFKTDSSYSMESQPSMTEQRHIDEVSSKSNDWSHESYDNKGASVLESSEITNLEPKSSYLAEQQTVGREHENLSCASKSAPLYPTHNDALDHVYMPTQACLSNRTFYRETCTYNERGELNCFKVSSEYEA